MMEFVMNITVKYMTTIAERSEEVKWKYITARSILYYTILYHMEGGIQSLDSRLKYTISPKASTKITEITKILKGVISK